MGHNNKDGGATMRLILNNAHRDGALGLFAKVGHIYFSPLAGM